LIQYVTTLIFNACCPKSYINGSVGFRVWWLYSHCWCCRRRLTHRFFSSQHHPRPSCTTHELTPSLVTRTLILSLGWLPVTMSQVALTNALPITNSGFRSSFHSVPASTLFLLCSSFHRDPTPFFVQLNRAHIAHQVLQGSRIHPSTFRVGRAYSVLTS